VTCLTHVRPRTTQFLLLARKAAAGLPAVSLFAGWFVWQWNLWLRGLRRILDGRRRRSSASSQEKARGVPLRLTVAEALDEKTSPSG
jgi:hypothetical protein